MIQLQTGKIIILVNESPEAFIAVSSLCSPKLPNAIIEASRIESGSATGTQVAEA